MNRREPPSDLLQRIQDDLERDGRRSERRRLLGFARARRRLGVGRLGTVFVLAPAITVAVAVAVVVIVVVGQGRRTDNGAASRVATRLVARVSLDAELAAGIHPLAPAADLRLPILGGRGTVTLARLRGKVVIVNFFARSADKGERGGNADSGCVRWLERRHEG